MSYFLHTNHELYCFEAVWHYYKNITFPARVIVEVDNHIPRVDIFDYHTGRKCNIYFIIPNRTLDPLFSEVLLLLNRPIMVRGDPKGK